MFESGKKSDHHFKAKFNGKSNGDGLDALKRCLNPKMYHRGLIGVKKSKNLKFELGEELNHHSKVKFYGKSNGDSLESLKRCSNPKMGRKGLTGAKTSKN